MKNILGILLPVLLFASGVFSKDDPGLYRTEFRLLPGDLFYFDDTDTILYLEKDLQDPNTLGKVRRTTDAGKNWSIVKDIAPEVDPSPDEDPIGIHPSPYDNKVAVVIGYRKTHWVTYDQGESWTSFEFEHSIAYFTPARVNFHADDSKKVIIHVGASNCIADALCLSDVYYTTDGFKTKEKLESGVKFRTCRWAKGTDAFSTGDDSLDKDRILCIARGRYSQRTSEWRLLITDDYSKSWDEPTMSNGRVMPGFQNMAIVKRFIVAAVRSAGSKELSLYATHDTKEWHHAEFGDHKIEEDDYTILESTNYSIQVDVRTSKIFEVGTLFSSNSNGTYFTQSIEHTNRVARGWVDFEKMANTQGVILVNVVDNWDKIESIFEKKVKSKISFDDGRTYENLKSGDKDLHLHSYTQQVNIGPVFTSSAPGLAMGVGNTGEFLDRYDRGDLYISDDGGLNWFKGLDKPHKYEFGDQGAILVAINDEGPTNILSYSLNHGKKDTWKSVELENTLNVQFLTTAPDSTSLKFLLTGTEGSGRDAKYVVYSIDFKELGKRRCEESDFETWYARKDKNGKSACVMGQKQSFRRRKADVDCSVEHEFKDPEPSFEPCPCTDADYECDYNFHPNWEDGKKNCLPSGSVSVPEDECKDGKGTYSGSSGWRLIPGNKCEGGVDKTKPAQRDCKETQKPPKSGEIVNKVTLFPHEPENSESPMLEWLYLERPDKVDGNDETIVMLAKNLTVYITHDHGKHWEKKFDGELIYYIYRHEFDKNVVYFIGYNGTVYYSKNRGKTIHSFTAKAAPPNPTDGMEVLGFHAKYTEWLLYTGKKNGQFITYISTNDGHDWKELAASVKRCKFMFSEVSGDINEKMIYCLQNVNEDPSADLQLVKSVDFFERKEVIFEDVANFARMEEFILIALKASEKEGLRLQISVDGENFAEAKFPHNFFVEHQTGYTILPSKTHSIFLHVTESNSLSHEYGSIIKSNSNGTSYVMSLGSVNRNNVGDVDFEKMEGLEGIALSNIVSNKDALKDGKSKRLQSMITHNDGADWNYIEPPEKDLNGKPFACSGSEPEKCALHLHGYTERLDKRVTYSSQTAVGVMIGVGNVGESLGDIENSNTFLTRDGGFKWKQVKDGRYIWEYGDQGSIIVLVQKNVLTKDVFYSVDEGETWTEHRFSASSLEIAQISTLPSDTSKNFLLWGVDPRKKAVVTVNLDFSGKFDHECILNDNNPEADDYELWTPRHPDQENGCLFGHKARYHRKKKGRKCWNGSKVNQVHGEIENCECVRSDFECDFNYERQKNGDCKLVQGLSPSDPQEICKNDPELIQYWDITSFRKIPLSTCEGGKEMDHTSQVHPCPGHEDQYQQRYGIGGFALFLAIVLPFAAAGGIGYYVWRNWNDTFGRIRLGESSYSRLDSENPWISWPVAAVSGLVAILAAIPLLIGSLWRNTSGRFGGGYGYGSRTYTSRSSFARGRGDYAVVDPDEGELLGEDSEEEA